MNIKLKSAQSSINGNHPHNLPNTKLKNIRNDIQNGILSSKIVKETAGKETAAETDYRIGRSLKVLVINTCDNKQAVCSAELVCLACNSVLNTRSNVTIDLFQSTCT